MSFNNRRVIYIASPYTKGDPAVNVQVQLDAAHRIMDLGHTPIAPLLSHFLHIHRPRPYQEWLDMDLELVSRSDILLRLPGESSGADKEVEWAVVNNIPVAMGWAKLYEELNITLPL